MEGGMRMADREKVIKGLECCMKWTGEPDTATCHCSDCSYTNMDIFGQRCLIDLINDALELLKEQEAENSKISNAYLKLVGKASKQPQIVRCKDCKNADYGTDEDGNRFMKCIGSVKCYGGTTPDFFCADGVAKDINVPGKEGLKYMKEYIMEVNETGMVKRVKQEIVRCKDCIHRGKAEKCVLAAISEEKDYPLFMLDNRGEWFCADGEEKT